MSSLFSGLLPATVFRLLLRSGGRAASEAPYKWLELLAQFANRH